MTEHSWLPKIVTALDLHSTACFEKAQEAEASWFWSIKAGFLKVVPGTAEVTSPGILSEMKILRPYPRLLSKKFWSWDLPIWALTNLPDDSKACKSLRHSVLEKITLQPFFLVSQYMCFNLFECERYCPSGRWLYWYF